MARDFTIYNSDVREKTIFIGEAYSPIISPYAAQISGYMPFIGQNLKQEIVYSPLSYQIAGPISLRGVTQPYQLSIGGND